MGTRVLKEDASYVSQAHDWLFETAVPLWLERGMDRQRGGFYDALDPATVENTATIKRLRVATRQIYVFSQATRRAVPGALDAVTHGVEYLLDRFRSRDGAFASCCDLDGKITDPTRDLYDLAFTLFAFGSAYSVTADSQLRGEALRLLDFIEEHFRHPQGGFVEALPFRSPRRQNPHMHLFEAALVCHEHFGGHRFASLCEELGRLFEERMFNAERRVLYEYFHDDLSGPLRPSGAAIVEPGHHFEWAWLLREYERLCSVSLGGAKALAGFAVRHGLCPTAGLLRGELFEDGRVAMGDVRVWPHAEWLRAAIILPEIAGPPEKAWRAIERFLSTPIRGLWFEHWDAGAQRFKDTPVPATTLYHLTTAISCLLDHEFSNAQKLDGRHRG